VFRGKPFDLLAEGVVLEKIGSSGTPIELFTAGIATLDPRIQQLVLAS
jgi:hypothetical protein